MATRLVLLPYVQDWDGATLTVRLLLIPRGNPLDPLDTGAPSFPDANLVLDMHIVAGLDTMPTLGGAPTFSVPEPVIATATPLFNALATQFPIDPTPPTPVTRPPGTAIKKHLPTTYQNAVGYTPGRTPLVFTDDTYSCALQSPPPKPYVKLVPPTTIAWGKVVAALLRQPKLSEGAGLVRTLAVAVDPATLKSGGWFYATLASTSDGAGLLATPDGLKVYTARIPPLSAARSIFTPVMFPVAAAALPGPYDELFAEVDDYDDGFAKAVHCAQPQQLDPLQEVPDGTRPVKELGIRLGWDDEQVTIWLNRQIDPAAETLDAPMGVQGYRVDVRETGTIAWHSLTRASGPVKVNTVDLGTFDGELGVETHPVQLHGKKTGDYWLPTYFNAWTGPSLVTLDTDRARLSGAPIPAGAARVTGTTPDIPLRYGTTYDFRVRLMDHTGGGPTLNEQPTIPGPAPTATILFRRWIRPLALQLTDPPPPTPDPANPPTTLTLSRPLLHHPAVVCTGAYADPIGDLLADMNTANTERREVGLADPDVDRVLIVVEAQGLVQDPAASDGGFTPIYQTTRAFPATLNAPLTLQLDWADVTVVSTMTAPADGPILLPTARNVRLLLSALGRDDPHNDYFGADDVRHGPAKSVKLRKNSSDETNLFAPDLPTHRFAALFLQPDIPVDATVLFAQRAAGNPGQTPTDAPTRLATALQLRNDGLTLRSQPGRRIVFGAAPALRHVIGPDGASISFASSADLTRHWLVIIRLTLARDWSWDGLTHDGIVVQRGGTEVGRFGPGRNAGVDALTDPDRTGTDLVFIDAVDPKPSPGEFPDVLNLTYIVTANLVGNPNEDPPLTLAIRLPVTTPPAQRVQIVSAGIALSPYTPDPQYTQTQPRRRVLWLELNRPPHDPHDRYFGRVLRVTPDPILTDVLDQTAPETPEPPLPIDPELIRTIVENQSDDTAGLDAMQELIASDSPVHFGLPLPPGMDDTAPELFGFFTYELRAGHNSGTPDPATSVWSTAQGRFGAPLRVTGVQHPAPTLSCMALRNSTGITVSAPFALPVIDGRPVQPIPPQSEIWVLLYAQAEQIDGAARRNILLGRKRAPWSRDTFKQTRASNDYGTATFGDAQIRLALQALGFHDSAPLSVLAVELLPNGTHVADPLGAQLGTQRVLRTSPLTPVPTIC
jgi:hypothetical protein